ncbi:hypothetical protein [Comamonas sp. C11]|uniref:hypothetical protein n=1 Tax=Comamonas sp. C11 TaxID=2966554 RepID=UPI0021121D64|nr:hypothetical protein [Comamonas sp. C11]UUC95448.1 hypothetical protein NOX35_09225 [Comamonas sp. C11]
MKQPIKMTPGDELHLTALMAPFSLNLVTGQDRQHLLGFGRAAFEAGKAGQCLHQIQEPYASEQAAWHAGLDEGRAQAGASQRAMVRYCPECGHVGEVGAGHRDCCPDGSQAFMVPEKHAKGLRAGFLAQIAQAAPAAVAVPEMPKTDDRRPYNDAEPDGYLESDNDWIGRNLAAVHWFIENHAAIRAALAATPAPSPVVIKSDTHGMNLGQRILHVGGRENAQTYIEFGSVGAVDMLVSQVLRDLPGGAPGFEADFGSAARRYSKDQQDRALLATATGLPAQAVPVAVTTAEELEKLSGENAGSKMATVFHPASSGFPVKLYTAPQAQADARDAGKLQFLMEADQHLLHRFIETTEDDESYDLKKEEIKRLAELGVVSNHGFGRYSVTMFGYWAHEQFWHQNPSLPLKTNSDRDREHRAAIAAQAAQGGEA